MRTRNTITEIQTASVWQLHRGDKRLAVIERAWDDCSWFLFLPDHDGELTFHGIYGRVATLKAVLRLWALRGIPSPASLIQPVG